MDKRLVPALLPVLVLAGADTTRLTGDVPAWPHDAFAGATDGKRRRRGESIDDVLARARANPNAPAWPQRKGRRR